jgi:hypothetical protein
VKPWHSGAPLFLAVCLLATLPLYGNVLGMIGVGLLVLMALTPAIGRR